MRLVLDVAIKTALPWSPSYSGVEPGAEVADLGGHAGGEVGGGGGAADDVDEGGADDDAVGHRREFLRVLAVADAEAEADGQGADCSSLRRHACESPR